MPRPSARIEVVMNDFPTILRQMPNRARNATKESANRIAIAAARRSRVRTGRMRSEWVARHYDDHSEVTNPVPYTVFNEFGTYKMSAQPMLVPSVEEERARYIEGLGAIVDVR